MESTNIKEPQAVVPAATTGKRYAWWRVIIWVVISIGILYVSSLFPIQSGEDSTSGVIGYSCNCTTYYSGFPFPWAHSGTDILETLNSFIPHVYAQVTIPNNIASCLPGCSGILGNSFLYMILDFLLYVVALVGIDVLAVKKNSKKYYWLLPVIFLVMLIIAASIPGSVFVTDVMRL